VDLTFVAPKSLHLWVNQHFVALRRLPS
jgi:hypothetical protein